MGEVSTGYMLCCWTGVVLVVLLSAANTVHGAHGHGVPCTLPESIEGTNFIRKEVKENYTSGEIIVHFCSESVGYGTIVQTCMKDGKWSAPSRKCSDPPPIGGGTAVGFSFAALNLLFVVMVLVRNFFMPSLDEEGRSDTPDRPI